MNRKGARLRHGHKAHGVPSPTYKAWQQMRSRCSNPRAVGFPNYGGRGVAVCQRWDLFENFLADMGVRPTSAHSIDRVDNDLGYEPSNCRWATFQEQQRNRRNNHLVTYRGMTASIAEMAERHGCKPSTVQARLSNGATAEQAFYAGTLPRYTLLRNSRRK